MVDILICVLGVVLFGLVGLGVVLAMVDAAEEKKDDE